MFSILFSLWILKGFLDGVSLRYDETALINGGSRLHTMFRVVLPQVKPGLVAAFIFNILFVERISLQLHPWRQSARR